jgi:CheY-like chemotaxis protein
MFSRRQPAERRPVRLVDVVLEAVQLVRGAAPPAVEVTVEVADEVPYLLGDPTQLHQVVMNLCTNAVQAMGDAGGTLAVSVAAVPVGAEFARRHPPLRAGDCVRLTIADTGPGMPQVVMDRLFEPFFTTKAPGVGTGLGLSVVHGVVQNHEGAIVVESRPGAGTTFEVYLPAVGAPSRPGEDSVTEKTTAPAAGRRVLFVDDEASIARLAQVMLKSLGHTATTFGRPVEGLSALKTDPTAFDLVITDLTMPGMTGVDLAKRIREVRADIPIILSSGFADEVPEETLKALGIVEVLPKPFQMQALGAAIARATSGIDGRPA